MMTTPGDSTSGAVTQTLISGVRAGEREAFDRLFAQLYDELRRIAHARLRHQSPGETLTTTALVHEAYVKLVGHAGLEWADRAHFLALASRAMRFVLVDYARAQCAAKRGADAPVLPLDELRIGADERAGELVALDDALGQLAQSSERLSRLVEYRFFGGLSYDEIAEVTGLSVPTVKRDWARARTWLYRTMRMTDA